MAEDWIYDSVVGFLCSRLWGTPVLNFIEQNCIVFDTEEENKFSYTEIHQNYAKMVESLLESYLEDLKITPEQFVGVCSPDGEDRNHGSFEQVIAANDFEVFKRMMVERNIELELQALEELQKKLGFKPGTFDMIEPEREGSGMVFDQETEAKRIEEEERLLQEAISRSTVEHKTQEQQFEDDLAQALAESARLAAVSAPSGKDLEKSQTAGRKDAERTSVKSSLSSLPQLPAGKSLPSEKTPPSIFKKELPSLSALQSGSGSDAAAAQWLKQAQGEMSASALASEEGISQHASVSSEDILRRQAYLKARRDKLIAKKERGSRKRSEDESEPALAKETDTREKEGGNRRKSNENLKHLMQKLKTEVVDAKKD
eukprot:m.38677 g.38677  ORF g.38677 m.38677 type:complete len:372 (+) comp32626_c0_seq1:225-1340(+)